MRSRRSAAGASGEAGRVGKVACGARIRARVIRMVDRVTIKASAMRCNRRRGARRCRASASWAAVGAAKAGPWPVAVGRGSGSGPFR